MNTSLKRPFRFQDAPSLRVLFVCTCLLAGCNSPQTKERSRPAVAAPLSAESAKAQAQEAVQNSPNLTPEQKAAAEQRMRQVSGKQ